MYDAARRFTEAGHEVLLVDQYDGDVFDAYDDALDFATLIGYPELMRRALAATEGLRDGFAVAGFSNGAGMAEFIATRRRVGGVLMFSGALPLIALHEDTWPDGVPAQIHYTADDPFRTQQHIDSVASAVRAAGATIEVFDYPGDGHLFTDASLIKEYDEASAELFWERVLSFCTRF